MNSFQQLGISAPLAEVLANQGITLPTPIQQQAIPVLLQEKPTAFLGLAQTGTGKTAAFGLPLVERIENNSTETQVLVMSPTRELSQQTAKQLVSFSSYKKGLNVEVVYGGAAIQGQIKALRKPTQIVVATPGRLLDLIRRKAISLKSVRYVVLDEADEMLNMGFKEDIDEILSFTNDQRVTWLFSATMPKEIRQLVHKYMRKPVEKSVNTEHKTNQDISHQYVVTKTADKLEAFKRIIDSTPEITGVMFCRTRRETQQIADDLSHAGYGAEALHGEMTQAQRDAVMKKFKSKRLQILIATDVAARGIDVNDLSHVFHHTLPDQIESYTHRSGRTGRAGNKGISLAFINGREARKINALEKANKIKFERIEVPKAEDLLALKIDHWANLILKTSAAPESEEILEYIRPRFDELSRDELLKRLITTQLDHFGDQEGRDLNEGNGVKAKSNNGKTRYFINVGTMDGLTKGDLLHFISDTGQIPKDTVGNIELHKSYSFFEIDGKSEKGFASRFDELEIDGRALRVNKDDQAKPRKNKSEKRKYKPGSKRKQRRG